MLDDLPPLCLATTTAPLWPWVTHVIVALVSLIVAAFFQAFDVAFVALDDTTIRRRAQDGIRSAQKLRRHLDHVSGYRDTVKTWNTLLAIVYGCFVVTIVPLRDGRASGIPLPLLLIALAILGTAVYVALAQIVPQRVGARFCEPLAAVGVYLFDFLRPLVLPITVLAQLVYRPITSLCHLAPETKERLITEEALRSLLDASREAGHLEAQDKAMIEKVFAFDDTLVGEVMTHRIDMSALKVDMTWDEVYARVVDEKYSRYPVYETSIDEIVGLLYTKDLLATCHDTASFSLRDVMRQPFFTPETRNIKALFNDLKQRRLQMAIVIDEYGGTAGLVTVEDLIEELVGAIEDEFDDDAHAVVQVSPGVWLMDGGVEIEQVQDALGVVLPDDHETLSGFIIAQLDRIPDEEEHATCRYQAYEFHVLAMDDNRIRRVRVTTVAEADLSVPSA